MLYKTSNLKGILQKTKGFSIHSKKTKKYIGDGQIKKIVYPRLSETEQKSSV